MCTREDFTTIGGTAKGYRSTGELSSRPVVRERGNDSLIPRPSLAAFLAAVEKRVLFSRLRKKAAREGLGTRLGK